MTGVSSNSDRFLHDSKLFRLFATLTGRSSNTDRQADTVEPQGGDNDNKQDAEAEESIAEISTKTETGTSETSSESTSASKPNDESDHLDDLADGAGCTEIWEHLSEGRDS
ncbi:hypothetical protein [Haloquadratum walsbyi]|jgi:hypothetical protein|uniref:Uncharacterized protein n=1 Tax=Haloquadratum walsbyi J07HQW2 TaxID=1238425 RepID=U1NGX3_9EURY|nr:hypothetical protein [Haloquadratum walsbyi]ERG96113.1 MAG: hypothetical protein J07HQW2_02582 [Haloquadratum walsbyi J07HQW2]